MAKTMFDWQYTGGTIPARALGDRNYKQRHRLVQKLTRLWSGPQVRVFYLSGHYTFDDIPGHRYRVVIEDLDAE